MDQNPVGRPAFKPSPEDRQKASHLSSLGLPQNQIAKVFGITPKTLRKHFAKELHQSVIDANTRVLEVLYEMATSGKNAGASIFWAKAKCGFRTGASDSSDPPIKPPKPKPPSTIVVLGNDGDPPS